MTTLLVVGRTGSGKSSVGNSILGKQEFNPRTTTDTARLTNERKSNDMYTVIDCSGIGDTGNDMVGDVKSVIKSALDGISMCYKGKKLSVNEIESNQFMQCIDNSIDNNESKDGNSLNDTENDSLPTTPSQQVITDDTDYSADSMEATQCGFDALIFVIKYGLRFTNQEKDSVDMVKSIFGENVFKDWGILVFSYGDNFYPDDKDDENTFEDWCKKQTGDIKNLFQEVDDRYVIFDNKSRNKRENILQKELLKQHIQIIVNNRKRKYTRADFVSCHVGHGKLLSKDDFGKIQSEVNRLIEESNDLVEKVTETHDELQAIRKKIRELLSELQSQKQKIDSKDQGTGLLKDLETRITLQKQKLEGVMAATESSAARPVGLLDDIVEANVLLVQQDATAEHAELPGHRDSNGPQCWNLLEILFFCFNKPKYEQLDETNPSINLS